MSRFGRQFDNALDMHITGNYGENQFIEGGELLDCSYECYAGDCEKCDGVGCDCPCHAKKS